MTNSIPSEMAIDKIYPEVLSMLGDKQFCKTTLTDELLAPYSDEYRRISRIRTMLINHHRTVTRPETRKASRKGKYIGRHASRPRKGHSYATQLTRESTLKALWV